MDRGGSQLIEDRFLSVDMCVSGVPPDAIPVVKFESSDEEGISSEPEVQVHACLHIITDLIQIVIDSS